MKRTVKRITIEFEDDGPMLSAEGTDANTIYWNSSLASMTQEEEPRLHMKFSPEPTRQPSETHSQNEVTNAE